jgi:hypothetical protein
MKYENKYVILSRISRLDTQMFVLIDKIDKKGWSSKSCKEISRKSGIPYSTLNYWARKKYYETVKIVFCKTEDLKSRQGGKRKTSFK